MHKKITQKYLKDPKLVFDLTLQGLPTYETCNKADLSWPLGSRVQTYDFLIKKINCTKKRESMSINR